MGNPVFEGEWWNPDRPERRIAGRLSIPSLGSPELQLIGSLRDETERSEPEGREGSNAGTHTNEWLLQSGIYPRILGQAGGFPFTLEDCFQTHRRSSPLGGGLPTEQIHVGLALQGVWLGRDEPRRFTAIEATLDHLPEWVARSGFSSDRSDGSSVDETLGRTYSVTVEALPDESIDVSGATRVRLVHVIGRDGDWVREAKVTQDFRFRVEVQVPTELGELLEHLSDFQDLVSIGTGRTAAFRSVALEHPDARVQVGETEYHERIALHAPWRATGPVPDVGMHPSVGFFTLEELGGLEGTARWLTAAAQHRTALGRVMGTVYDRRMRATDRLMNRAAALEAYDTDKFHDPNKTNYVDRLKRCAAQAGVAFVAIVGDLGAWTERMKDARNEVAHRKPGVMTEATAYHYLGETAYWLFVLCMLQEAGASGRMLDGIADHPDIHWLHGQIADVLAGNRVDS